MKLVCCKQISDCKHKMQILDGADGAKALDDLWPAFHQSEVHATPVMVDFDYDGVMDILLATNDGELLVIKDTVRSPSAHPGCPTYWTMRGFRTWYVPQTMPRILVSKATHYSVRITGVSRGLRMLKSQAMINALPISVQGEILPEKLIVPRLRIRKDWYQKLAPDPTDHSHPDLGTNPDAQDGTRGETFLPRYPIHAAPQGPFQGF